MALRPPALSGAGLVGGALAVDPGLWRGALRLGLAWLRDGAAIPGEAEEAYLPVPADDGAAIACRVTATGQGGAAAATTPAITIAFPPPTAVGPIPDLVYTLETGTHVVNISPFFSGGALRFSLRGAGAVIDPETGVVTIDLAAIGEGSVITFAAANSGGRVELDLALRLATPPARLAAPTIEGEGLVGAALRVDPGLWSGRPAPALALQWLADGAPVAGATEAVFVPGAAEDGAAIACRVTAWNDAGSASAETAPVVVRRAAPVLVAPLPDLVLARDSGPRRVDAALAFAGEALVFAIEGAGATIDPATGLATIPTDAPAGLGSGSGLGGPVVVRAANSGGAAEAAFAVALLAAPAALATPGPTILPRAAGTATLAAAGLFAGDDLAFALEEAPEGVAIDPASGVATIPTAAHLAGALAIRASNPVGTALQRFGLSVLAPPAAAGTPPAAVFLQGAGAGTATISAQAFFTGDDLAYALEAAPAGATINPGSGLVSLPTAAPLAGEIAVRASNPLGAAVQRVAATVRAARTGFAAEEDGAAGLDHLGFAHQAAAPSWTWDPAGFARLAAAANDRAFGDWRHAGGDGRYRVLARWSAGAGAAPTQSRPFGFVARMSGTGADQRLLRIDVVLQAGGARVLQLRELTGGGAAATMLGTPAVAWAWDAWQWLEVELDGPTLRARLYPEGETRAGWSVTTTTSLLAPGAFGPASYAAAQIPLVDIRRIEFQPPAAAAPAAAGAGDWTLAQTKVQA